MSEHDDSFDRLHARIRAREADVPGVDHTLSDIIKSIGLSLEKIDVEQGANLGLAWGSIRRLENEFARANAALLKYGYHDELCAYMQNVDPCTCGFEELRASLTPDTGGTQ